MKKNEIEHINWIYNRLINKHQENPNVDYMILFKKTIDKQLNLNAVVASLPTKKEITILAFNEALKMQKENNRIDVKGYAFGFIDGAERIKEIKNNK